MCRVGRKKESPLLVRLQVHLTKCRREAQLVWTCVKVWHTDLEGRACVSSAYSFVSLFLVFIFPPFRSCAFENADLHVKPMQRSRQAESCDARSLSDSTTAEPWDQWQRPCCVLLLPLMSMFLTSWRRLSCGWLRCWQDYLQLSAEGCASILRAESCMQHSDFPLIPQTSSSRTESYHPAP